VLLVCSVAFSVIWAMTAWEYGIRSQGASYTRLVLALNALWATLLTALGVWGRVLPQFWKSYLFHWLLFAWLGWYAFPFLGELP
jgi:hypothetical protein